jgi:hypothetical protein
MSIASWNLQDLSSIWKVVQGKQAIPIGAICALTLVTQLHISCWVKTGVVCNPNIHFDCSLTYHI